MIGSDLLRYKKNQLYLIADHETEGLNLFYSRPWQIAFLIAEGEEVKERFEFCLKWPNLQVGKEAARICGFNPIKYNSEAKDPKEILPFFEKYLYDKDFILLSHNWLGFDTYIHSIWRRNLDLSCDYSYLNNLIDTNCVQKAIKLGIKLNEGEDRLAFQYRLYHKRQKGVKTGIDACCREYGITIDETKRHQALYDCEINFEIWNKQKWAFEI